MKKIISLVLAVLMLVSAIPMAASAVIISSNFDGTFYYTYVSGTYKYITGIVSGVEHVVIPEEYTGIDSSAFLGNDTIVTVTIPKTLEYIRANAFGNCSNLRAVIFDYDRTETLKIYKDAFYNCDSLYSVYLPERTIAVDGAFNNCDGRVNPNYNNLFMFFAANEYSVEHIHNERWLTLVQAHCSGIGFSVYGCSCGYVEDYKNTPYDYNVHKDVTTYPAVEPTCILPGSTISKHCNNCNSWFGGEEIPAPGHKKVTDNAVAATCDKGGLTEGTHCSVCKEVFIAQNNTSALGHTDNDHDGICDRGCGHDFTEGCSHLCHKGGFWYKLCLFFWKLFKTNKGCSCGMYHY